MDRVHTFLTARGLINFGAVDPPSIANGTSASVEAGASAGVPQAAAEGASLAAEVEAPAPPSMKLIKEKLYVILRTVDFMVSFTVVEVGAAWIGHQPHGAATHRKQYTEIRRYV